MPVTSYYCVQGQILGERSEGTRTDYVPDAIASVVATVDSTGALQNQYAYSPYGRSLSRSGVGSDPAFRWVGVLGYRATTRSRADQYVRARHYDPASGRWTTVDAMWPAEEPFDYVIANPTVQVDPSGYGPTLPKGVPMTGPYLTNTVPSVQGCGYMAGSWQISFMYKKPIRGKGGYVIGHVLPKDMSKVSNRCDDGTAYTPRDELKREWWEAWCVDSAGRVYAGSDPQCKGQPLTTFADTWYVPDNPDLLGTDRRGLSCRQGSWSSSHMIYYFEGVTYDDMIALGFTLNGIYDGAFKGQLVTRSKPTGWVEDDAGRVALCITFNCCNSGGTGCVSSPPKPKAKVTSGGPVQCYTCSDL